MIHMRHLTSFEEANIQYLINRNVEFTRVQITGIGMEKSILDATAPMRVYFKEHKIHNYDTQPQGREHKILIKTTILDSFSAHETQTSFYRPETKHGDPRIWIYGLTKFSFDDDIHAIIAASSDELYTINITRNNIQNICDSILTSPLKELIDRLDYHGSEVAEELLGKLKEHEGEWIPTTVRADTGIGRQVETLLEIPMNASKEPDYKGIELKSFRDKRNNRKNLFSQVPDWNISYLKSAAEIVQKYGYLSNGIKSYRNTVTAIKPNSQSLRLNMNYADNFLELEEDGQNSHAKISDVAVWRLMTLHQRLKEKHHETFWIAVKNKIISTTEQFMFEKIEHTRNPNVSQFDSLLEQGIITVDLLLGRPKFDPVTGAKKSGGDTVSFKLKKGSEHLLFPENKTYFFRTSI